MAWQRVDHEKRRRWELKDWVENRIKLLELQNYMEADWNARKGTTWEQWEEEYRKFRSWQENDLLNRTGYTLAQYKDPATRAKVIMQGWRSKARGEPKLF